MATPVHKPADLPRFAADLPVDAPFESLLENPSCTPTKAGASMTYAESEPLTPSVASRPERLFSIDALRGFDMFWIIGGDSLAHAIGKWWGTPASKKFAEQFDHVAWEGFRFYDLIFPLFLFLVGVVLPYSLSKYQTGAHPKASALGRIARRVVFLFVLGLIGNGLLQFDLPHLRVTGVLQRIAICYGFAAVIFLFSNARTQAILVAAILLGYYGLLMFVPTPETGKGGDFAKETNLAGYVDRHYLPGEIKQAYYGYGDNEGLLSTIPAVATTLLGVLAGQWLMTGYSPWVKVVALLAAGAACLGAGTLWGLHFPVIKILWTSSYVLIVGGWSLILLGLFHAIIDVSRFRAWSYFFVVIGVNAITIYMAARIIPFDRIASFFFGGLAKFSGQYAPGSRPVVLAAGVLAVEWLLLLYLYRKRIFLRV
jgi:predicted acyltransferase